MRALVRASVTDPEVVGTAARIAGWAGVRDTYDQAQAVRTWLAGRFRFVRDPVDVELLREPRVLLRGISVDGYAFGDCDDAAVLAAALCMAVGLPVRFVVVAFGRVPLAPYRHVYTEAYTSRGWTELDVTGNARARAMVTRRATFAV